MGSAAELIPDGADLDQLRRLAATCQACDLYKAATQTVFGDGPSDARLVLVGEQPGDKEDVAGEPFVGPAGRLLDEALAEAGIDRATAYVTNIVKHFKWRPAGRVRLHQKPSAREVAACRPWLHAEVDTLHPEVVVCLGATAAQAILGRAFRVTQQRGQLLESPQGWRVLATVHPSSILRAPDQAARQEQRAAFVADLRQVAEVLR